MLVRVRAAGVSYPDGVMTSGVPYVLRLMLGLRRPRHGVRGLEVAGTVAAVGLNVADLRLGDEVFGSLQAVRDWAQVRSGQKPKR